MLGPDRDDLTICAVATPSGYGGISVIRVSGADAVPVSRKVFPSLPQKVESHRAYFGTVRDVLTSDTIDQALVLYLAQGHSYTGEDTFEISCHGNPVICDRILKSLIAAGSSAALPGEFTYRAFMNNRLDLIQAESVLSLIESRSQKASILSFRQLEGHLSEKIEALEHDITWCLAHIEANIDFSTEGLEVSSASELIEKIQNSINETESLVSTYRKGKLIQDGIRVAFIGQPNVGKSSLLNLLLGFDRAIVDSTPGTTRDVVDADFAHQGQRYIFIDTAGLREQTQDHIEKMGIQRSQKAALESDLILFVIDAELGWSEEEAKWFSTLPEGHPVLFLINKSDKVSSSQTRDNIMKNVQIATKTLNSQMLFVSALDKRDRELILDRIHGLLHLQESAENEVSLSQARHYENLNKALGFMRQAVESLKREDGAEFISLELKEALLCFQETLGKYFDDQIMDKVFKEFCIGK